MSYIGTYHCTHIWRSIHYSYGIYIHTTNGITKRILNVVHPFNVDRCGCCVHHIISQYWPNTHLITFRHLIKLQKSPWDPTGDYIYNAYVSKMTKRLGLGAISFGDSGWLLLSWGRGCDITATGHQYNLRSHFRRVDNTTHTKMLG